MMESKVVDQKILLAVVALLVVIIAVFALLNRSGEELHEGEILIKAGGTTLGVRRLLIPAAGSAEEK